MVTVMNKRKEKISAFLDNDMHRDELMSFSLSAASDDAKTAQRYQMMGDTLRGEMSDSSFVDVSQAVRGALADENIFDEANATKTAPLSPPHSDRPGIFHVSGWFRPVAGMAVAATVAVVLVTALSGQEAGSPQQAVAVKHEQQPVVTVAVEDKTGNRPVESKMTDIDQRLINQHLKFATQDALQGRMPYVRAVSFESNQ